MHLAEADVGLPLLMAKSRHASLLAGYVRCDRAPQAESWA